MDKRILELALEALQAQKNAIEAEIAQLRGGIQPKASAHAAGKRLGPRSAARREAQSTRMRLYWKNKKALAAKAQPGKKATIATLRPTQRDAANKARSAKMKAFWAKKRAESAKSRKLA